VRILATADLHLNHPRSAESAQRIIEEINAQHADAVLVVGDAAVADESWLERCLSMFRFDGPRLFVPGNHEYWTKRELDFDQTEAELIDRVRKLGWRWLPEEPAVIGDVAIVGSVGWYDYSFAEPSLDIPELFYRHKVSPGSVLMTGEPASLLEHARLLPPARVKTSARWNDGRFIRMTMSDEQLVDREVIRLQSQLSQLRSARSIVAAIHTVPFAELLPARSGGQWDFARAYLGSKRIGAVLGDFANVRHVLCGHSHTRAEAQVGQISAINIGSGYRHKQLVRLDV
jgi:3',5'-cyclic AMP phosphodiesterase CpdA